MNRWKWRVTGYYASSVKAPKTAGELAHQTVHANDHSAKTELDIFMNREDIGRITIEKLRD